jgi:hypothetical protein
MAGEKLTVADIKQGIRDMNIWPWQLYDESVMKNDKVFGKLYEENSKLSADNERLQKENEDLTNTSKEAVLKTQKLDAKEKLEKIIDSEKLTDMQKNYISSKFDPEAFEEINDDTLKGYVTKAKEDFAKDAKFFGVNNQATSSSADSEETEDPQLTEEKSNVDKALEDIGA